jgi:hypothetical protein
MSADSRRSFCRPLVAACLTVGVLDGTDAVVFYGRRGVSASRIFRSIASSVPGRGTPPDSGDA